MRGPWRALQGQTVWTASALQRERKHAREKSPPLKHWRRREGRGASKATPSRQREGMGSKVSGAIEGEGVRVCAHALHPSGLGARGEQGSGAERHRARGQGAAEKQELGEQPVFAECAERRRTSAHSETRRRPCSECAEAGAERRRGGRDGCAADLGRVSGGLAEDVQWDRRELQGRAAVEEVDVVRVWGLAVGETVILLHPPLPVVGVSIRMERGCQQNGSLADGYLGSTSAPGNAPLPCGDAM